MGTGDFYMTYEGYERVRKELESLKKQKRRELSKEIEKARALGDLSENAEYHAAKEAQALNEKKIRELEEKLSHVQLLDEAYVAKGEARLGAVIKLKDLDSGEEFQYMLVSEPEADFSLGKISITSPVGKGLLGCKVGDVAEIKAPARILKYKVVKITR